MTSKKKQKAKKFSIKPVREVCQFCGTKHDWQDLAFSGMDCCDKARMLEAEYEVYSQDMGDR